eukprot:364579-Chlamydomonas_euryale.AAC.2
MAVAILISMAGATCNTCGKCDACRQRDTCRKGRPTANCRAAACAAMLTLGRQELGLGFAPWTRPVDLPCERALWLRVQRMLSPSGSKTALGPTVALCLACARLWERPAAHPRPAGHGVHRACGRTWESCIAAAT